MPTLCAWAGCLLAMMGVVVSGIPKAFAVATMDGGKDRQTYETQIRAAREAMAGVASSSSGLILHNNKMVSRQCSRDGAATSNEVVFRTNLWHVSVFSVYLGVQYAVIFWISGLCAEEMLE